MSNGCQGPWDAPALFECMDIATSRQLASQPEALAGKPVGADKFKLAAAAAAATITAPLL